MAKKPLVTYECSECQAISSSFLGKCPSCNTWGTLKEKKVLAKADPKNMRASELDQLSVLHDVVPIPFTDIKTETIARTSSGFDEFDRVLGGGVMPGSYILLGGDPGIGKSTLMLQVTHHLACQNKQVLYVAGEESPFQIKQRGERLGLNSANVLIYPQNNIQAVMETLKDKKPDVAVIDSIQSLYHPSLNGTPGSPSQIKECAGLLMTLAKTLNITIFLIGHVTKEGQVSGPKLLEHTVDTVLYFEGEKYKNLRILRTVKNRFGGTQEIGVFEMDTLGLKEVTNPSELFLSGSQGQSPPGSIIVPTIEGSRPLLVEIQSLVGQSAYSTPRRVGNGIDTNRLHQIVAVLERRLGLDFSHQDIYVNVVGGLDVHEPAADLGIALSIITSQRNLSAKSGLVAFGEIGLTGEIRPVRQTEQRLLEAQKIGFKCAILPDTLTESLSSSKSATQKTAVKTDDKNQIPSQEDGKIKQYAIEWIPVDSVMSAITACLSPVSQSQLKASDTLEEAVI